MIMTARNIRAEALQLDSNTNFSIPGIFDSPFTPVIKEDENTPIDSLIITGRPSKTLQTLESLAPRLSTNSTIVLMHSEIGVYEHVINRLFRNPEARPHFILASSRHEHWQKSHNHVVHTRIGSVFFSIVPDPKGRDFEAALRATDTPRIHRSLALRDIMDPPNDPHLAEYATLYNTVAVLNRLTDLHVSWIPMEEGEVNLRHDMVVRSIVEVLAVWLNCRNGEIFQTKEARRLGHAMCREAAAAFRAQWRSELKATMAFTPQDTIPDIPVPLRTNNLMVDCIRFTLATHSNIAPMLRDIIAGRNTEIRYGLGHLLQIGLSYRATMPTLLALYKMIKARQSVVDVVL
jgi:2-dehydropantoate 2-reductase